MARPVESQLTISCLQCDWSVETVNTPSEVSRAFLEAAYAHTDEHEQHALEVVQRSGFTARTMSSQRHLLKTRDLPRPVVTRASRPACWTGLAANTD